MQKRLIVIGGGAAGFFCAITAASMSKDLNVTLVEKTSKLLSKVRVSGGGRCNVTHACFSIAEMVKNYPRGANCLKKAFQEFFTADTIKWFAEKGVHLKTEEDGRMFPVTDTSQTIIDCLIKELNQHGVEVRLNLEVKELIWIDGRWKLKTNQPELLEADFVCVAAGGFSKPQQFDWLKQLGHSIEEPVPSLFTFNMPGNSISSLMGVTVAKAMVKIAGTRLESEGPVLITHWGLSGPAILKLSAWSARELAERQYQFSILVNWVPDYHEQSLRERFQECRFKLASQKLANRNPFQLPQRLWEYFLGESGVHPDLRWADLASKEQNRLVKNLTAGEFAVKGKTTFKEEFVTAGGIQLAEVDARTMMSRIRPGLFFAGEVLNIDGVTGGFNFQSAWTTGFIAGRAAAAAVNSQ